MKTNLIMLAMLCLAGGAFAQREGQVPYFTKSLKGEGIKQVYVNTSGGSITVSGQQGQEPRVEMYVNKNTGWNENSSKEEAKAIIDKYYTIDIESHNGELHVSAKTKGEHSWFNWNTGASISFKVYVPENSGTDLHTSGGSIHLDNLHGREDFETSGGSLHADHLVGTIKGRTSGGSIHISDSKENIDLSTSGGSVEAEGCDGTIRLETSGGSLHLSRLNGDIHASTSGGSVHADEIRGQLITSTSGGSMDLNSLACSLEASTSGGGLHAHFNEVKGFVRLNANHIDLSLPAKQGYDLDIRGSNLSRAELKNFDGDFDREHIHGKMNGGGAAVHADAEGGHVSLSFN